MPPAGAKRIAFGVGAILLMGGIALVRAAADPGQQALAQDSAKPAFPLTEGQPPGGAFLIDLRQGLDPKTQYLSDFDFTADWIQMSFKDENVRFGPGGMLLVAARPAEGSPEGAPYTGGEFQRRGFYGYGRYEVVMRSSDAPGTVSSFFTHTDGQFGDPHSEIDIEFVGRSPRQAHLNYFVGGRDNSSNVDLGFDASKRDHLYAFEWAPEAIRWYVDGRQVREVTPASSEIGIPGNSGRVIANIWTGNRASEEWVGTPQFDEASASYSCMSHVPIGQTGRQCSDSFVLEED